MPSLSIVLASQVPWLRGFVRAVRAVTPLPVVPHPEEEDRKMLRQLVGEGCRQGWSAWAPSSGTEPGLGTSQQEPHTAAQTQDQDPTQLHALPSVPRCLLEVKE